MQSRIRFSFGIANSVKTHSLHVHCANFIIHGHCLRFQNFVFAVEKADKFVHIPYCLQCGMKPEVDISPDNIMP